MYDVWQRPRGYNAKQHVSANIVHGRLDAWHGVVKVLEHSDRLEEHAESGLVTRYYELAKLVRKFGGYGGSARMFDVTAKQFQESWMSGLQLVSS